MAQHVEQVHHGMIDFLLSMDKKYTGLSDIQISILKEFNQKKDDTQISKSLNITKSNVRNHRFRLKEKAKQAKVFLTIFEMIEAKTDSGQKLIN
jgi:transcriptional regulator